MIHTFLNVVFNLPLKESYTYRNPRPDEDLTGYRVTTRLGRRKLNGWVVGTSDKGPEDFPEEKIKEVERVVDKQPLFNTEYIELARWIADLYLCSLGEALSSMLPGGKRESGLPSLGFEDDPGTESPPELNEEQNQALESIFRKPEGLFYLFGITGSGKTEVFLQAAARTLDSGRSVIYLVPEITLTHQLISVVRARFPGRVALLHSHLTPSQKLTEWRRIQEGEARFILGARSAVFAPLEDPGLIIIDEEHESSYKSGSTPRYNGRQVALHRCRKNGSRLIMGSATPSAEAWHLMEKGVLTRLTLTKRAAGGAPPHIDVVDMRNEGGAFSLQLIAAMREVHNKGGQSLLFLNRRGFSYSFSCRSCGHSLVCRQCSVGLTYHKNRGSLVCHYCGYQRPPVQQCPECGSMDVGYYGFGTERLEEEVAELFPGMRVARLDADSTGTRGKDMKKTLTDFRKGDIDVLLGTQMVAKGLNFPGVKLVGIILADTTLNLPDYRAEERTFALITQVAGRAGRYIPDGKVIIQTYKPDSPAIALAATGNLDEFYTRELDMRKQLRFPPFFRLFRLVFRGKDKDKTSAASEELSAVFRKYAPFLNLLGPAECALGQISGNWRFQLIIRTSDFSRAHHALNHLISEYKAPHGVYVEIDVDPVSLL